MRRKWFILAPIGFLLFLAVGGEVVRLLWNWLVPPIFGWHAITFWQALGLLALCRILFGGFGKHGFRRSGGRGRMRAGWQKMTPEERERFRQGLRDRCGPDPAGGERAGGEPRAAQ